MRPPAAAIVLSVSVLLGGWGCASQGPLPGSPEMPAAALYENPLLVPTNDYALVWETVADVVDDEFRIEREDPVRQMGDVLTEGRLDTFPLVGSTLMEPWRNDAANTYEKVEGTLQSIRRRALVRVVPAQAGQWVEVIVYKELEDTVPIGAAAGTATFRYDNTLTRLENPVLEQETARGWISQGRDTALEQHILGEIQSRVSGAGPRPVPLCESTTLGGP